MKLFYSLFISYIFAITGARSESNLRGRDNGKKIVGAVTCDICVYGDITNIFHKFKKDGRSWKCGYLQKTVKDVDPKGGSEGERQTCKDAQLTAEEGGCCTKT